MPFIKPKTLVLAFLTTIFTSLVAESQNQDKRPVTFVISRMTHDHISFILGRLKNNYTDLKLTGIFCICRNQAV